MREVAPPVAVPMTITSPAAPVQPPTAICLDYEELSERKSSLPSVDLTTPEPAPHRETPTGGVHEPVEEITDSGPQRYSLRHIPTVDYHPPAQRRRVPTSASKTKAKMAQLPLSPRVAQGVAYDMPLSLPLFPDGVQTYQRVAEVKTVTQQGERSGMDHKRAQKQASGVTRTKMETQMPLLVTPQVPLPMPLSNHQPNSKFSTCVYGARCEEMHDMRDDMTVGVILLYSSAKGSQSERGKPIPNQLVATDPGTKPISISAPCNRKEALTSPWWKGYYQAELAEMDSHAKNGTWKLVPRCDVPTGATVLRDRWAYSDKLAPNGNKIERFKARLTAMGCFQKPGIDYGETYASVMSTRTFRMLLQIYNSDKSHKMLHWDVSTAFIHAPLQERVYTRQASGHEVKAKNHGFINL